MARPPGFDRETVLSAVEAEFRKTGYAGTSLDDIAEATGLGRGSLYAAFGGKHQLFMQSLGRYCDRNESSAVDALSGPDAGALDRMKAFLTDTARCAVSGQDGHTACMAGKFALEVGGVDSEALERIGLDFDKLETAFADCLRAARRAGDLAADSDPDELATTLLALIRGIDVLATSGRDLHDLHRLIDQVLDSHTASSSTAR